MIFWRFSKISLIIICFSFKIGRIFEIDFKIVFQFVNIPPNQRVLTKKAFLLNKAALDTKPDAAFFVPTNKKVFPLTAYFVNCAKALFKQRRVFNKLIISY